MVYPASLDQLVPEARSIVAAAAEVYRRHTEPWFVGLVVHGSALKGGVIPGCSDVDFQLYLDNSALDSDGELPVEVCSVIQRDLARIDPSPFQYLQCWVAKRWWATQGSV